MVINMNKYIIPLILLLASTCFAEPRLRPEVWAKPVIGTELDNLYSVDEGVFRSEQPHEKDMEDLMSLGIKEILSLREYHGDKDDITDDHFTISIDSSGDLLHRRGYRTRTTKAPLRETLAAGALMLLEWNGSEPLSDPLCGSGSFPLEGALLAQNRAYRIEP